ncbi:MAG: DUF6174 domain-containing protein [Gemmatimonadota bacterium]
MAAAVSGCQLGPTEPYRTAREQLAQAEARWRDRGFTSYRFISGIYCFCGSVGEAEVTVLDGSVVSVVLLADGSSLPTRSRQSVDSLFAFVRRELDRLPERLTVRYDPMLGYPSRIDWGTPENDGGGSITARQVSGLR